MSYSQGDFAPFRRLLQDVKVRFALHLDVLTPAVLDSTACPPTPTAPGAAPAAAVRPLVNKPRFCLCK
jgi:hypothetical protein